MVDSFAEFGRHTINFRPEFSQNSTNPFCHEILVGLNDAIEGMTFELGAGHFIGIKLCGQAVRLG
jgi:hypothetical protein